MPKSHSTTILSVRHGDRVAIGGDGQVTHGDTILKSDTRKIRPLLDGQVLVGFAGSTADAFTLFERFDAKLKTYGGQLRRSAVELAKDWRTDKLLRRLEALLIACDALCFVIFAMLYITSTIDSNAVFTLTGIGMALSVFLSTNTCTNWP